MGQLLTLSIKNLAWSMGFEYHFRCLLIIFHICYGCVVWSQASELGIGLGRSVYYGDLNSGFYFDKFLHNGGMSFQTYGKIVFEERWGLKMNILYGRVKGDDAFSSSLWQRMRNLSFFSDILEFSVCAEYYLFRYNPALTKYQVIPYVSAGIGAFYFNPKAYYNGTAYALRKLGTEGQGLVGYPDYYGNIAVSFPFGGGLLFKLTDVLNLGLEVQLRYTTTDYLDDVSTFYVSTDLFIQNNRPLTAILADRTPEYLNGPFSRPNGSQRGGQRSNDFFAGFFINVSYGLSDGRKLTNTSFLRKNSNL